MVEWTKRAKKAGAMISEEVKRAIRERWEKRLEQATPEERQALLEQSAKMKELALKRRADFEQKRAEWEANAKVAQAREVQHRADLKEATDLLRAAQEANLRALKALGELTSDAGRAAIARDGEALKAINSYSSKLQLIDIKPIVKRIAALNEEVMNRFKDNRRPILERMLEHDTKKGEQQ
jgi:hypothetical protein